MQEAFRRAIEQAPDSPIVPKIQRANRVQAEERIKQRKERQFIQVRQQFYDLGQMWYETQGGIIFLGRGHIPIEQKRKEWLQHLTTLQGKPSEERIELLNELASGMQLTGHYAPRVHKQSILQIAFDNPLDFLRDEWSGVKLTPQSILFMEAISDMSGHSKEQKREFRDFMVKRSGLIGKVGLPELFPAISRWLDHK